MKYSSKISVYLRLSKKVVSCDYTEKVVLYIVAVYIIGALIPCTYVISS